ncbi:MAG TPA: hypothetical protein DD412_08145 [Holosporales bacterium]|nr:hypothetical protein [Holosporales bacterium]
MKYVNKQEEQGLFCAQNVISITAKEEKTQKKLLSLKRNKALLSYLMEEKELTEQEVRILKKYRQFHFKSKRDIGAPRQTGSQMEWFEQGFKGPRQASSTLASDKMTKKEAEELQKFRQMRRQLFIQHKHTILFIEALFEYANNDLDFFKKWSKEEQKTCIKAFKFLAKKTTGLF